MSTNTNSLQTEISAALNRASAENASGTPDYILARFLMASLAAFEVATRDRAEWRGEQVEFAPTITAEEPA